MAKLPRIDLTGITTNQLIKMDDDTLMDFTRSQFRGLDLSKRQYNKVIRQAFSDITSRLVSTANKRIRKLEKSKLGKSSPAYISASKGAKFSVRGKNYNQLRNLFKTTKQFLTAKTSTISGWKQVRERVEEDIGEMTAWEEKKFWKAYRELEETNGGFESKTHNTRLSSDQIQKMLHSELVQKGWRTKRSTIIDVMNRRINEIYLKESQSEDEEDFDEVSEDYDEFD